MAGEARIIARIMWTIAVAACAFVPALEWAAAEIAPVDPPFAQLPPEAIPQPQGGGDRNAIPLYKLPNMRIGITSFPRCRCACRRCADLART